MRRSLELDPVGPVIGRLRITMEDAMSTKIDYSADEWTVLLTAPLMAALAVVAASPSGPLGVLRELFAVGKLVAETKTRLESRTGSSTELFRALVTDLASPDGRAHVDAAGLRGLAPERLQARAIETCRTIATLLDRKVSADEAQELKRWLVTIAQRTAEAVKEGGVMGFGGTRVSPAETTAIHDVARALGLPPLG